MKLKTVLSKLVLIALTVFASGSMMARAQTVLLDQVVAIVEDDIIMASELETRLAQVSSALEAQKRELPTREVLVREALDRLVLESIQLQLGRRVGVRISDAQLNDSMSRIAARSQLNLEQFQQKLEIDGESYVDMREEVRRELILQRVQAGNVNQRVQITEQEVESFLESEEGKALSEEEYHLIHALLPLAESATAQQIADAEKHLNGVSQRIQAGEPFEQVIAASSGRFTFTGGDLGWRKNSALPSLFADVAPALEIGQSSAPIQSPSGYHIIYMAEKRGGTTIIPQTHVRHILVKPTAIRDDEETRLFAESLHDRVADGEDFGELAREFSEDIGSAQEGGDLSWTSPGQMVPEFDNMMDATEIDAVSAPFRSQFGWHILQVLERRQEDITDDIRFRQAQEFLHSRKYQEELDAWLRKIRDEAFVDIK